MIEPHQHECTEPGRAAADKIYPPKSAALIILTFGGWLLALFFMGGRMVPVVRSAGGTGQEIVLWMLVGLLGLFWLLGAYYLSMVILYFWERRNPEPLLPDGPLQSAQLPVAILYPTCDDFQREAALTCVQQRYGDFHVFLLDDSRSPECREQVDRFHREFPECTSIVRRRDRSGFKAGNLNHALRGAASGFPVFAVMDADERIPEDFLRRLVGRLMSGYWAFVQAAHAPNPKQASSFAQALGQTILPFWEVLLAIKNRFGFVPCVGHGLVVRRSAWSAVGGFPEVLSEDLEFSARLLALGFRGFYLRDVVCHEDFPPTLEALRNQQRRYLCGVLGSALRFWPRALFNRRIRLVEKIDLGLSCLPLYVPVFCLGFLALLGIGMVIVFGTRGNLEFGVGHHLLTAPYIRTFDERFRPLWNPYFVAMSAMISISPALPTLALALSGRLRRPFRLLVVSHLIYMSTMFVWVGGITDRLMRIPVQFNPTMGRDGVALTREAGRRGRRGLLAFELLASVALVLLLALTLNFGLAAVACCPVLARTVGSRLGSMYCAGVGIFTGVIAQFVLGFLSLGSPVGLAQCVVSIHF